MTSASRVVPTWLSGAMRLMVSSLLPTMMLPPIGDATVFSCGAMETTSAGAGAIGDIAAIKTLPPTSAISVNFEGITAL
ncbi:hypothetical protein ACQP0C_29210 [Nocardia sp. CA-129566]|uniref:hypothetical protein n=1 Tax=Nocardia sp. CA-129566 TaxID=3239976 RepID=UPI003D9776B9